LPGLAGTPQEVCVVIRRIAFGSIVVALLVVATAEAWGAQAPPTATSEPTMTDDMGMMMGDEATPSANGTPMPSPMHQTIHEMMDATQGAGTSDRMHAVMGPEAEQMMEQCSAMMTMMMGMMGDGGMMGMGATPGMGMDGMNGMDGMQGMMTPTAAADQ
jgi:hypothetical protein